MAKMFPKDFKNAEEQAQSNAEKKTYEYLRDGLGDSYTCFMGLKWESNGLNGEIDFLVMNPGKPLCFIEVKGGKIEFDGLEWKSTGRSGEHKLQRSPVDQARRNKSGFINRLRSLHGFPEQKFVHASVLAVLPDTPRVSFNARFEAPEAFATIEDLQNFERKLDSNFKKYLNEQSNSSKEIGVGHEISNFILNLFGQSLKVSLPPLAEKLRKEQEEFQKESEAKLHILNAFSLQNRVHFQGGAGTGKTILAMEKALRCASSGKLTLLTCYNDLLAEKLKENKSFAPYLETGMLRICNFHRFCEDLCTEAHLIRPPADPKFKDRNYWEKLEKQVWDAVDKMQPKYEAIIVDEGQDFKKDWFDLLEMLQCGRTEDVFYVFHDPKQNIQKGENCLPQNLSAALLDVNLRTTLAIHNALDVNFMRKWNLTLQHAGPEGRLTEFIEASDEKALKKVLQKLLHRLLNDEKLDQASVVLLTGTSKSKSALKDGEKLGNFTLTPNPKTPTDIRFETVRRFKGLECAVVIAFELEGSGEFSDQIDNLKYVAVSRANSHFIYLGKEDILGGNQVCEKAG